MTDLATIADGRHAAALARGEAFMAEETVSMGGQYTGPDAGGHAYRVASHAPRGGRVLFSRLTFRAVCACGWESDPMPRAGMAHAAHDAHAAPTDTDTDTDTTTDK